MCGLTRTVRSALLVTALVIAPAALLLSSVARAQVVVYQNTANPTGGSFGFNGAVLTGSNLAANVDLNELTLAAGSAGDRITSLSFLASNFNTTAVAARPTMYVWAANGAGGDPGTLLGSFALPLETLAPGQTTLSLIVPTTLIVPASMQIWAGIGFDNDNGASAITAAQLNILGALTYHPATVGTDGATALFIPPPNFAVDNPATFVFGSPSGANYGWTVSAAVPEPSTWAMMLLGFAGLGFAFRQSRRKMLMA
jgi:hypothetical protein